MADDDDPLFAPFTAEELGAAEQAVRAAMDRMAQHRAETDADVRRLAKSIGTQLTAIATQQGITVADLATRTEMTEHKIKRLMRGTLKNPSIWQLSIIAQAMGHSLVPKLVDRQAEG